MWSVVCGHGTLMWWQSSLMHTYIHYISYWTHKWCFCLLWAGNYWHTPVWSLHCSIREQIVCLHGQVEMDGHTYWCTPRRTYKGIIQFIACPIFPVSSIGSATHFCFLQLTCSVSPATCLYLSLLAWSLIQWKLYFKPTVMRDHLSYKTTLVGT